MIFLKEKQRIIYWSSIAMKQEVVILKTLGNGKFIKHPLPIEAQFAPVNAIICDDLDNDGLKTCCWPAMNTRLK